MSKGLKLIGIVVGIALMSGLSVADITSEHKAARVLYKNKQWAEAQVAYEKIIETYPQNPKIGYYASMVVGTLLNQGKVTEAKVAAENLVATYPSDRSACANVLRNIARLGRATDPEGTLVLLNKILEDYPDVKSQCLAALRDKATALWCLKRYAEQQEVLETMRDDYDKYSSKRTKMITLQRLGVCLHNQKKYTEANKAIVAYICFSAETAKASDMNKAFLKITRTASSFDEYKVMLQNILLAVPATEVNAEFLGRVKSELEKMK